MTLDILGIIPARMGSTRFPGKPLADIHGLPMIAHVYNQVIKYPHFKEVIVATDSWKIADACKNLNIPWVMTKDTHTDCLDRAHEVVQQKQADVVVVIQGDEPLFNPESLEQFDYEEIYKNDTINCLYTLITKLEEVTDDSVIKVVTDDESRLLYMSRAPIPHGVPNWEGKIVHDTNLSSYYKQIGTYAFTKLSLARFALINSAPTTLESTEKIGLLRALQRRIPVRMVYTKYDTVSVDTPEDLEKVKEIMSNG